MLGRKTTLWIVEYCGIGPEVCTSDYFVCDGVANFPNADCELSVLL